MSEQIVQLVEYQKSYFAVGWGNSKGLVLMQYYELFPKQQCFSYSQVD